MLKARRTTKKAGRRASKKARRVRKRSSKATEYASARQVIELPNDVINGVFVLDDVNLSQFDRLRQIAGCYQFYRIDLIEMKFKPFQDTFIGTTGIGTTGSVPYLHYLIDTSEVLQPLAGAVGFNQMRDAGATPIRFDEKTVNVKWKPRVPQLTTGDSGATPAVSYAMATRKCPWLPTNANANDEPVAWTPSRVPHKGLYYGVEQDLTGSQTEYGIEITVHMSFKKPLTFTAFGTAAKATKKVVCAKNEVSE